MKGKATALKKVHIVFFGLANIHSTCLCYQIAAQFCSMTSVNGLLVAVKNKFIKFNQAVIAIARELKNSLNRVI